MSQSEKPDTEISNEEAGNQVADPDAPQGTDTEASKSSESGQDSGQAAEQAPDQQADSVDQLQAQLDTANEQIAELKDDLIRSAAEMQNVRKRLQRDVENAHKYGLEKFLINLLPVIDAMEKAIEAANQAEETNTAIVEGVELCLKMLLDILGKENVEQISPEGEPFDPKFHEAMSVIESPDVEPNSVVNVFQKGYTLNGRLVKPAMVIVSKASEQKVPESEE
jgi:molecular chaperone GrpE